MAVGRDPSASVKNDRAVGLDNNFLDRQNKPGQMGRRGLALYIETLTSTV
jgi:hypothetical protein